MGEGAEPVLSAITSLFALRLDTSIAASCAPSWPKDRSVPPPVPTIRISDERGGQRESQNVKQKYVSREFPGGLVLRIQCFHCHGLGSIPGQELRSHKLCGAAKKKKERKETCF